MYDPVTARFMQEDTYMGNSNDPLSLNLYTYCENEPVMYIDPSGYAPILINIDGKDYYPEEIPYLHLGRQNGKGIEAKANGDKNYKHEDFGVYGDTPAVNNLNFNVFPAIKRLELDGLAVDELSAKLRNPSLSAKERKSLEIELERRLQGYNNSYSTVSGYGFTIEDGYNVIKDDRYYTALAKVYYQGIAQHINDFQNNEYFAPFETALQITQAAQAIYMGAKLSQMMSKATNTYNNEAVSARNSKVTYSNSYQYAEYTKPTFIDRLKEAANGVKNDVKVLGKRIVTETRGSTRILPPKKPGAGVRNAKVAKQPIKQNEVTTYQDFVDRSVVGDNLEGHEVWQHANLKANGLATERLSTKVSKNNPVIALERSQHKVINKAQRSLDAANQTPLENIEANSNILREAGIPQDIVDNITNKAKQHARKNGGLR